MNVPISQKPKFILLVSVFTAEPAASRLATSFPVCRTNPLLSLEPAVPETARNTTKRSHPASGSGLKMTITISVLFICQGKMPLAVRQKYESLLNTPKDCDCQQIRRQLQNFDEAMIHPTRTDLENAALFATECIEKVKSL